MKTSKMLKSVVLSCCLVSAFACDNSDDDGATAADVRASVCAKGKALNCTGEANQTAADCVATANRIAASQPNCVAQFDTYMNCLDDVPASEWECQLDATSGLTEADVKSPNCDAEYQAMDVCVAAN